MQVYFKYLIQPLPAGNCIKERKTKTEPPLSEQSRVLFKTKACLNEIEKQITSFRA